MRRNAPTSWAPACRVDAELYAAHARLAAARIADAQALAEGAAGALEAVREPYTAAYEAWSRAQSRFAQFVADLDHISPAPTWPSPPELFHATATERRTGRYAARLPIPAQLRELPQDPTPEPEGTSHVWESADGVRLTATVGDVQDVSLDADPDWRLIASGAVVATRLADRGR